MANTRDAGVHHGDLELWYLFILMDGSFRKSRQRKVMAYSTGKLERMIQWLSAQEASFLTYDESLKPGVQHHRCSKQSCSIRVSLYHQTLS